MEHRAARFFEDKGVEDPHRWNLASNKPRSSRAASKPQPIRLNIEASKSRCFYNAASRLPCSLASLGSAPPPDRVLLERLRNPVLENARGMLAVTRPRATVSRTKCNRLFSSAPRSSVILRLAVGTSTASPTRRYRAPRPSSPIKSHYFLLDRYFVFPVRIPACSPVDTVEGYRS